MFNSMYILAFQQPQEGSSFMSSLIPIVLIFVVFYFMIIRPQQKRQKERDAMLNALQKGDKIITSGGIHATIIGIEEKSLLVQIADNVKVKIERGSIASVLKENSAPIS